MKNLYLFVFLAVASITATAQSNLFVDTSYSAEEMVMDFFSNSCVTPSNITFNGVAASLAFFDAGNTDIGVGTGILITTGTASDLIGVATDFSSTAHSTGGDADLSNLVGGSSTYDGAVLEFDITIAGEDISFEYVFGSEEYPEYVGSGFNDVFAFLIEDNGLMINTAMIPGTSDPVAINNVNAGMNSSFFVDYATMNGQHTTLDGLTTILPTSFTGVAGTTYHVKIAVADVFDTVFDSGVFISTASLCGEENLVPPTEFSAVLNGSEVAVENLSKYASSWTWDFGDGTIVNERNPAPHIYQEDGIYTITLTAENSCCTEIYTQEVVVGNPSQVNEIGALVDFVQPNPVQDQLQVQLKNGQKAQIQLLDRTGRTYIQQEIDGYGQINMSALVPGIYLLQVITEQGVATQRVVKQ